MRRSAVVTSLVASATVACLATGFPVRTGLTRSRAAVSLPGDLLLPTAPIVADRAVTIDAPPQRVWPWLTQIGRDHAESSCWTAVENHLGCRGAKVRGLGPDWSGRAVGDEVTVVPGVTMHVAVSAPGRALVLTTTGGSLPQDAARPRPLQFDLTWAFVLIDEGDSTVLHVRERYLPGNRSADLMIRAMLVGSAVVTRRMLRSIKGVAQAY